tara:strand:- start:666 stop:818 length:153 start_codon:yes stop_codon:yes gene_type:complete
MDFNQFKLEVKALDINIDEMTLMDAYANYEINNITVEAAVEQTIEDELYY